MPLLGSVVTFFHRLDLALATILAFLIDRLRFRQGVLPCGMIDLSLLEAFFAAEDLDAARRTERPSAIFKKTPAFSTAVTGTLTPRRSVFLETIRWNGASIRSYNVVIAVRSVFERLRETNHPDERIL